MPEDPQGIAQLLEELHAAGAGDAARALLARDPAGQVSLGPNQQPGAARAADAGMFGLEADRAGYRFGREPDGAPAPPWRWAELLPDPGAAGAGPAG
jgi:hypothetical protein